MRTRKWTNAYWTMNEGAGNILSDSGPYSIDLSINNAIWILSQNNCSTLSYLWSTETTQTIEVNQSGSYNLELNNNLFSNEYKNISIYGNDDYIQINNSDNLELSDASIKFGINVTE